MGTELKGLQGKEMQYDINSQGEIGKNSLGSVQTRRTIVELNSIKLRSAVAGRLIQTSNLFSRARPL